MNSAHHDISQGGNRNIAQTGADSINISGDVGGNVETHLHRHHHHAAPSSTSSRHQLRAPVGDFVGREAEIAQLLDALSGGGGAVISGISGLGGIGNTELALVVAGRLRDRYPDAQLLIELRGTDPQPRSAEEALAECVRAFVGLEARLPGELDKLVKLYRDCLAGRRVLVVLDNAADANQVRPLLVPEGCALLVTSRETIHLPKMVRIRLDKLPPDKACELLLGIAPHAASVADQICYLCGYLPLALRAAASLLDVTPDLDPAIYAAELRDERAAGTEIRQRRRPRNQQGDL